MFSLKEFGTMHLFKGGRLLVDFGVERMLFLELQIHPSLFFIWYLDGGAAAHKARKFISEVSKLTYEFEYAPDTFRLIMVLRDVIEVFDVVDTILS
jgi:hypothetical protein